MTRLVFLVATALSLFACAQPGRTCSSTDGSSCTQYTGIAWTDAMVRDACSRASGNVSFSGPCAASPYGTCVVLDGSVSEARVFVYTAGATEAVVEAGCCSGGGQTWISGSTGERRPCAGGGGIDEGI